MQDNFTIAGGLKNGALPFQPFPKRKRIDEIPVVDKGDSSVVANALHDNRLRIALAAISGRGVSRMADRVAAFEAFEDVFGEHIGNIAHRLVREYLVAVRRGNACALLSPMLQGIEA